MSKVLVNSFFIKAKKKALANSFFNLTQTNAHGAFLMLKTSKSSKKITKIQDRFLYGSKEFWNSVNAFLAVSPKNNLAKPFFFLDSILNLKNYDR